MVSTSAKPVIISADEWMSASWAEFAASWDDPAFAKSQFYFFDHCMRIEMPPIGSLHGQNDFVVSGVVRFYAASNQLRVKGFSNTSFRKPGEFEFQPDIALYVGEDIRFPPQGTSAIDLNDNEPPTLVIEIASTSLNDDLGRKRLLYEQVGVREYWVVDVKASQAIAFDIPERGRSGRIQVSQVLPGLKLAVVEEALKRSKSEDTSEIDRWLIALFAGDR